MGNDELYEDDDEDDAETDVETFEVFASGWMAGYEAGIRHVSNLLQDAVEYEAPFPAKVRKALVVFGRSLAAALPGMVGRARAHMLSGGETIQ